MFTTGSREKSSQSNRIHFGALRDEKNRRFVSLGEAAESEEAK